MDFLNIRRNILLKIKNRKWIGAGIFAVSLLALAAQPQKVHAEEQLDGVMGQSIEAVSYTHLTLPTKA